MAYICHIYQFFDDFRAIFLYLSATWLTNAGVASPAARPGQPSQCIDRDTIIAFSGR
jgi:hypothetical protein